MSSAKTRLGLIDTSVSVGSHILYLYDAHKESPIEPAAKYAAAGLEEGDKVVLVFPRPYLNQLISSIPGSKAALANNRLLFFFSDEIYYDHDRFSYQKVMKAWRQFQSGKCDNDSIRTLGIADNTIALDKVSYLKLAEYESALNIRTLCKLKVCSYDVSTVPKDAVNYLVRTHKYIACDSKLEQNDLYLPHDEFVKSFYARNPEEFTWQAAPENCRLTRAAVAEIVGHMPFDLEEIDDVLLAVGEALSNAIRHGSPCGADNCIRVRVIPSETRITIEISDEGSGILCELPEVNWTEPGGKGFYLMNRLCDKVEHFSDQSGCTVRLIKNTSRQVI